MDFIVPLFVTLKGYFPAILGSLVAVWKRESNKDIKSLPLSGKLILLGVSLFALIISVFVGHWIGGAIAAHFGLDSTVIVLVIEFFSALSSLKIIDGVLTSVDSAMKVVVEKVPQVAYAFFDGVIDKIKNLLK